MEGLRDGKRATKRRVNESGRVRVTERVTNLKGSQDYSKMFIIRHKIPKG